MFDILYNYIMVGFLKFKIIINYKNIFKLAMQISIEIYHMGNSLIL